MRTLVMRFKTDGGGTFTVQLHDPKERLTEAGVYTVMQKCIVKDVFCTSLCHLAEIKDAYIFIEEKRPLRHEADGR